MRQLDPRLSNMLHIALAQVLAMSERPARYCSGTLRDHILALQGAGCFGWAAESATIRSGVTGVVGDDRK